MTIEKDRKQRLALQAIAAHTGIKENLDVQLKRNKVLEEKIQDLKK